MMYAKYAFISSTNPREDRTFKLFVTSKQEAEWILEELNRDAIQDGDGKVILLDLITSRGPKKKRPE